MLKHEEYHRERLTSYSYSNEKKMLYSKKKTGRPIDKPGEQMLLYPISCDHDGKPLKGQKSYTTNSLEATRRYKTALSKYD